MTELAAICGTSPLVIASWEKGRRKLRGSAGVLVRLLEATLQDWPEYWPGGNDWRVRLWKFPVANIIALRLRAERNTANDDGLDDSEAIPGILDASEPDGAISWDPDADRNAAESESIQ